MTGAPARRELVAALLLCLAGSGLAVFAATRAWLRVRVTREPPLPVLAVELTGGDLEPAVTAVALVGLAGVVALLATRRAGRRVVAALLLLAGLVVVVRVLPHLTAPEPTQARELVGDDGSSVGVRADSPVTADSVLAWPLTAGGGGLALAAGGALALVRSPRWPAMSRRYESPDRSRAEADEAPSREALWDAQDRGEDLTAGQRPAPDSPPTGAADGGPIRSG